MTPARFTRDQLAALARGGAITAAPPRPLARRGRARRAVAFLALPLDDILARQHLAELAGAPRPLAAFPSPPLGYAGLGHAGEGTGARGEIVQMVEE